ncbi:NACHT domain-containing protein [Fusarium falciforme]|uniref:NACHT domain-containing protein n=1 Tax=Fusarium falciforme TaxID=195108 RepID=UPI002301E132|nr:NACHT domain-containing protein [Fusarium falciforme]WAO94686.1 NACHT domain-containing protein [Fusarium falciforme]
MSFGFGVGDSIAVLELVNKVRKDFQSAPSQFEDISNEVRSLSIVLSEVDVTVSETELDAYQRSGLQHLVSSCRDVLETLEETLEKYRDLSSGNGKLRSRVKRVWKRINWEPDDIRELQAICAIKHGVGRFNLQQDNEQRLRTLDWLTPLDYDAQQQDFISRRQPGTGKWLLDSKEYQSWLTTVGHTLFCRGMPGAGKTILTSTVVEDLTTRYRGDKKTVISYIYFNFHPQDDQKLTNLLGSILRQCIQHLDRLPESVTALENESSDGCRASLLSELFKLQARCGVNIFATSRFIPDIVDTFENGTTLEIRASSKDIERYVKGRMEHLQPFARRNKQLQEEIKAGISAAVDGMFLLAQIFLDSLDDKLRAKDIRSGLNDLRRQIQGPGEGGQAQALDCAYEKAMERIKLQHALVVEPDTVKFNEENLPDIQGMVSACCGLVTIENESSIIRLVHTTTQEYFERTQGKWFPDADAEITTTCLTYLSFDIFEAGVLYGDKELIECLRSNPLYDYATQHWGHHARKALTLAEEIIGFLESGPKVEARLPAAARTQMA